MSMFATTHFKSRLYASRQRKKYLQNAFSEILIPEKNLCLMAFIADGWASTIATFGAECVVYKLVSSK